MWCVSFDSKPKIREEYRSARVFWTSSIFLRAVNAAFFSAELGSLHEWKYIIYNDGVDEKKLTYCSTIRETYESKNPIINYLKKKKMEKKMG